MRQYLSIFRYTNVWLLFYATGKSVGTGHFLVKHIFIQLLNMLTVDNMGAVAPQEPLFFKNFFKMGQNSGT